MLAGLGERALADAGSQIPFLLPQFHGVSANLGLPTYLLKVRPRGVVLIGRGLLREPQRLLPLRDGGIRKLRRQAGKRNRIAGVQGGLILPEALEGGAEVIGRAAAEGFTQGLNGGAFAGGHQGARGALDLGVGHGRASIAGGSIRGGFIAHHEIIS